jgi:hypothetical protein
VVLEEPDVWAPAVPIRLAPSAPPASAVAASAVAAAAFLIELMVCLLLWIL